MTDERIVALYWARAEEAISETAAKYSRYLHSIAYGILADREDAGECVNDTYHDAWNAIPPHRPSLLQTFLGKIIRRISIDRWRKSHAAKRGGGELLLALEELGECVSGEGSVEDAVTRQEIIALLDDFLAVLPPTEQRIFLRRYWYMEPIDAIAKDFGFTRSKVTSMLHRLRGKLRAQLEEEGYA